MADRNPLLVTGKRSIFDRILRRGAEHGIEDAQRLAAELEREARKAKLREKTTRHVRTRLEAFSSPRVGEPGSRPKLTGEALRRAQRRAERRFYGRRHGRQHRIPR